MDAAEEACDTDRACRLSLGEALYGEIHLQDARGRGRDPGALRRGARRTRSRPREPDRGDVPRRGRTPQRMPPRSLEGGAQSGERAGPRLPCGSRRSLAAVALATPGYEPHGQAQRSSIRSHSSVGSVRSRRPFSCTPIPLATCPAATSGIAAGREACRTRSFAASPSSAMGRALCGQVYSQKVDSANFAPTAFSEVPHISPCECRKSAPLSVCVRSCLMSYFRYG